MKMIDDIRRENMGRLVAEFGSVSALAAQLERTDSQISQWKEGSLNSGTGKPRGMRSETARWIEKECGKPRGWLDLDHSTESRGPIDLEAHPDLVSVRRVKFKLQAGVQGYAIELDNGLKPPIFFTKQWLDDRGYKAEKLMAFHVTGQSMEPNYFDGDLVVANTADQEPRDGENFAVDYEGEPGIKRLRREAGEWWVTSDNPDQRRFAPKRCTSDVKIIGRLVYRQSERV